jgi:hypothetical protein
LRKAKTSVNSTSVIQSTDSAETSHNSCTTSSQSKSDSGSCDKKQKEEKAEEVREKCKERLAQCRRTMLKTMVLSDQLDMRNPQSVAEFAGEIYQSMKDLEPMYQIDHQYL